MISRRRACRYVHQGKTTLYKQGPMAAKQSVFRSLRNVRKPPAASSLKQKMRVHLSTARAHASLRSSSPFSPVVSQVVLVDGCRLPFQPSGTVYNKLVAYDLARL
jgi:hypothetical protein